MRLRVPDASLAPPEVHYGARKTGQVIGSGPHICLIRVYNACCDSLAQKPCPSTRPKCLILWGRFAHFELPGIRCYWADWPTSGLL